jgi:AGCS family alanine or glycine:cation symporter
MSSDTLFKIIGDFGDKILFFDVLFWTDKAQLPFLIFWLLFASIYFSVITGFINFRKLPESIILFIKGKKTVNKQDSTVSSKSIVLSATAGATDLGSIFGVAGMVAIGGAGSIFWLIVAGFLSTSIRYAEVLCGHKFRKKVFSNGKSKGYTGGPQVYIKKIFRMYKLPTIGKFVATVYALMLCLSTFCSLQINQTVHVFTHTFPSMVDYTWFISLLIAIIVIFVVARGISSVAKFNQKIVPFMILIYVFITACVFVSNYKNIIPALYSIFSDAFSFRAVNGGILGAMVLGTQRAFFCNESGMGSGAIIHSNSSNKDSKKEAIISMITPIISVIIVCACSGLIVLVSNSSTNGVDGTDFMINAFSSTYWAFKYVVLVIVPLFGITTAIAWAYYGSSLFSSIFGKKKVIVYYMFLFISYFLCGMADDFGVILGVADFLNLSIAIPNVIALIMMSKIIVKATRGKVNN